MPITADPRPTAIESAGLDRILQRVLQYVFVNARVTVRCHFSADPPTRPAYLGYITFESHIHCSSTYITTHEPGIPLEALVDASKTKAIAAWIVRGISTSQPQWFGTVDD